MIDAAPPTYLSCTIGKQIVEITADEANQTATVFLPKWRMSHRGSAVFSPERVMVTYGSEYAATTYEIDRVTLTIVESTRMVLHRSKSVNGTCLVKTPSPERKF